MHFLKLRLDTHAQFEIRIYAEAIAKIIKDIVPMTWEAFLDYVYNSRTFSSIEMNILRKLLESKSDEYDWEQIALDNGLEKLEAKEFALKFSVQHDITN